MCEKCADLDAMIVHYRKLADDTADALTRITIEMLLGDLLQEKSELHASRADKDGLVGVRGVVKVP